MEVATNALIQAKLNFVLTKETKYTNFVQCRNDKNIIQSCAKSMQLDIAYTAHL